MKYNIICNNAEECYLTQKFLFKKGYHWGNDIKKEIYFNGFPIVINCNYFNNNRISYDSSYCDEKKIYYPFGSLIKASNFLRKKKLKILMNK